MIDEGKKQLERFDAMTDGFGDRRFYLHTMASMPEAVAEAVAKGLKAEQAV